MARRRPTKNMKSNTSILPTNPPCLTNDYPIFNRSIYWFVNNKHAVLITLCSNVLVSNIVFYLTFQRQTNGGKNAGYETVSSYQYKKSTESTL